LARWYAKYKSDRDFRMAEGTSTAVVQVAEVAEAEAVGQEEARIAEAEAAEGVDQLVALRSTMKTTATREKGRNYTKLSTNWLSLGATL
jgi:hypothetical protein